MRSLIVSRAKDKKKMKKKIVWTRDAVADALDNGLCLVKAGNNKNAVVDPCRGWRDCHILGAGENTELVVSVVRVVTIVTACSTMVMVDVVYL